MSKLYSNSMLHGAAVRSVKVQTEQPPKQPPESASAIRKRISSREIKAVRGVFEHQEAAAKLSISQRSLDYLVATKALSVRRIGSRVLVPLQDLQRFAGADHPGKLAG
jgi:hypothetical protein